MKHTQLKDALRNIGKQKVSYLSIIVIAFMGVTAFLGIDYSAGALRKSGSDVYNEVNFRDIEIVSTLLMSDEDMDAILKTEGVQGAEAVWQTGAKAAAGQVRQDVGVISLTERVNLPQLVEGRLPAEAGECAVERRLAEEMGWRVGDRIELTDAKGQTAQYLTDGGFVITGLADHPDHTSLNVPDTLYVIVTPDAFDAEALDGCFMKAEVVIDKPADIDRFSDAYTEAVAAVSARLEALAAERAPLRDAVYRAELDDNRAALDEGREQLDQTRAELDDGWSALSEGEQRLSDGERELAEGKQQLEDAQQQLEDARKRLDDAKTELAEAEDELVSGDAELTAARKKLASAETELLSSWEELEDAKDRVRGAIRAALDEACGCDTSEWISWASRASTDLSSSATARELWITDEYRVDLNKSLDEIISDIIYSGDIPDEALIAAYESLMGGDE